MISIVDDDESIRTGLRRLFNTVGYDVDVFGSAEEFLQSGDLECSDCLILDLRMPGMSGLELQGRLISCNCSVPTVFLTSHNDENARCKALSAGAVAYVRKPFKVDSLIEDVNRAVERRRMNV